MQLSEIRRHCQSGQHKQALRQLEEQGNDPPGLVAPEVIGVQASPVDQGGAVPRADRFVWAIHNCQRGASFRDFSDWCGVNDLTNFMSSGGVCRDSSRQSADKMVTCVGAVLQDQHMALIRRAHRLAFAIDDRDQVFVMRARVSFLRPQVGSKEFLVGLVRDYGHQVEDSAKAIMDCFRLLCTVRRGRREAQGGGETGETSVGRDYVDEELLKHVMEITFAGASDGCEVALQAVQLVKQRDLTALRYQFRDRPHTSRTCMKGILKYMHAGQELLTALISGKGSFAKRATHSRRFQEIWTRKQVDALAEARGSRCSAAPASGSGSKPAAQPDMFRALRNLAHAEHRFDSRSEPMSIMCSRFGAVLEVLLEMADDRLPCHREEKAWAEDVLKIISGPTGFSKLLIFGIDCDFAVTTQRLIRVQDQISPDLSLTSLQVAETLEVVEAVFKEGQVFLPEAEGLYTSQLLCSLRKLRPRSLERLRWEAEADMDLSAPKEYAATLHVMTKKFFKLNFPDYSWRHKFSALNCGKGCLPLELRLKYVAELATKEKLDHSAARSQFLKALPHMTRCLSGTKNVIQGIHNPCPALVSPLLFFVAWEVVPIFARLHKLFQNHSELLPPFRFEGCIGRRATTAKLGPHTRTCLLTSARSFGL